MTKTGLYRFVEAQETIYPSVLNELKSGKKKNHWMWFIFPQIKGLGYSLTARKFSIGSLKEARAYQKHEVLGSRLEQCTKLVLNVDNKTVREIFGYPDYLKFRSCMTLFAIAEGQPGLYTKALDKYFSSQMDDKTLNILRAWKEID